MLKKKKKEDNKQQKRELELMNAEDSRSSQPIVSNPQLFNDGSDVNAVVSRILDEIEASHNS